ncbi:hypothetical protein GXP67_30370 [Rhodocytophaga rosea]|uniref:Fibrobacter succinogenes major paralogous domain-containing protein n=1 Tax=Rhodocytophaga rosea TaxID=2704465 RepID=A0A6C0GRF0_9BACT|nr:FISUMP domain-containing protein [Rhodocytophaga rosea]QHT70651.1 hypothetical protein GXP67_30370 [Rhodocytophaga rosea]
MILFLPLTSCKEESDQPVPMATTVIVQGKTYPIVSIGHQLWTTINYDGPGGIPYKTGTEKPEYGRYYTFQEAAAIELPEGWRLPAMDDYITLAQSQGVVFTNQRATGQEAIKKLAAQTHWRVISGTNESGFNALPAGYSFQGSQPMDGDISEFWMADGNTVSIMEGATGKAHNMMFYSSNEPGYRFNLRFVRDK